MNIFYRIKYYKRGDCSAFSARATRLENDPVERLERQRSANSGRRP